MCAQATLNENYNVLIRWHSVQIRELNENHRGNAMLSNEVNSAIEFTKVKICGYCCLIFPTAYNECSLNFPFTYNS